METAMIDYYTHLAIFDNIRTYFGVMEISDPAVSSNRDSLMVDVDRNRGAAVLGTLIDHLLHHADSKGIELEMLKRASDLWKDALELYERVSQIRSAVELALANPSEPNTTIFNDAILEYSGMPTKIQSLGAMTKQLKDYLHSMSHLKDPHPRQQDRMIRDWDLGNKFISRRTGVFVRSLFQKSTGDQSNAFAFGVLASYTGNAIGSSYLGHVVGGPRRLHPYRDRLARNCVGAWLNDQLTLPSLLSTASQLSFGGALGANIFPDSLKTLLEAELRETYGPNLPDLDLGLKRLREHIILLTTFRSPSLPPPIHPDLRDVLSLQGFGDDITMSNNDRQKLSSDFPESPPSGQRYSLSDGPAHGDGHDSGGEACAAIIAAVIVGSIVTLLDCIVQFAHDGECEPFRWTKAVKDYLDTPPDPPPGYQTAQLQALSKSSLGADLITKLHAQQVQIYASLDGVKNYMTLCGLIYPETPLLMSTPLYKQFISIPANPVWPRKTEDDPISSYHLFPSSVVEQPNSTASQFPIGASPLEIFIGQGGHESPSQLAGSVWTEFTKGGLSIENLDQDSDRGYLHKCWAIAAGASILDNPISVYVLGPNEM